MCQVDKADETFQTQTGDSDAQIHMLPGGFRMLLVCLVHLRKMLRIKPADVGKGPRETSVQRHVRVMASQEWV